MCRLKKHLPRTFSAIKNPRPRISNLFRHVLIWQSFWSKIIKTKKTGRIRNKSFRKEKNGITPWQLMTIPLMLQKRRKRIKIMILVESCIITATKMAILQISTLHPKTSISLDNLSTND